MYLALQGFLANTTLTLVLTSTDSISHTHTTHSHTHRRGQALWLDPCNHTCDYIHTVSKVNSHTVHTYDVRNCTTCDIVTCGMKI